MRILLLGEYSNVHWTLAEGLRQLGHEVTVASDGDSWKNYPRDIDLKREGYGIRANLRYAARLIKAFSSFRGYDVVQLINPVFVPLKADKIFPLYHFLKKHNRRIFMGAFGMDYYWVKAGCDCHTFLYSDFNIGTTLRRNADNDLWIRDWLNGEKGVLNRHIAQDCDGIVAGLYEYDRSYRPYYQGKMTFIPFPINVDRITPCPHPPHDQVRFFIGIQKQRSAYKGTDIMLRALNRLKQNYPEECEMVQVESVPYEQYQYLMNSSDVILDQLYSYTPAMNALLAMAKGLIVVGGGEPENYEILHEDTLRPILNVRPTEESVYRELEKLLKNKKEIPHLAAQSVEYIRKHHHYIKVARQYLNFWTSSE